MKLIATVLAMTFIAGGAMAADPHVTYLNPPSETPGGYALNACTGDALCQYGFQDDTQGFGSTLNSDQQLGIRCYAPAPGSVIEAVGWFSEFWVIPGNLDIVLLNCDTGAELSRTSVFVDGNSQDYKFLVDAAGADCVCVMLCPVGSTWGVTGEDRTNGPFADTFWSNNCFCDNEFTTENKTIYACWTEGATPVEPGTWGSVKALYR